MCRRFSAWSQTADLRPVDDLAGDLLAAVRRQAVQHDDVVGGYVDQRLVQLVQREDQRPLVGLGLLPHARPDVGVQDVGAGTAARASSVVTISQPVSAAISAARCTTCGIGSNPGGVATRTVMPAFAPASSSECATLFPSPR